VKYGVQHRKIATIGDTAIVEVGDVKIGSIYWSPNEEVSGPLLDLEGVIQSDPNSKWLLGGDLNIGTTPWIHRIMLNQRKKLRSKKAEAVLIALDLTVCNNRDPTSYRQGRETINDYTLFKGLKVINWKVHKEGELSGHRFIQYELDNIQYEVKEQVMLKTNLKEFEELVCKKMPVLLEYNSSNNPLILQLQSQGGSARRSSNALKKCR